MPRPIRLRLDGEEIHVVSERDVSRWSGWHVAAKAAFALVTPRNIAKIRDALFVPASMSTHRVFVELTKQLEDGSAVFFEIPMEEGSWHAREPGGGGGIEPGGGGGGGDHGNKDTLHWIEVVCVSHDGKSYAGASCRLRSPDGRDEFLTLDGGGAVRLDDLTEGGTAHFELARDAAAQGIGEATAPTDDYEPGTSLGLVTGRRHVLRVLVDPLAFVSFVVMEGDVAVACGGYALTTSAGLEQGELGAVEHRVEPVVVSSSASLELRDLLLPARDDEENGGGGDNGGGGNGGGGSGGGGSGGGGDNGGGDQVWELLRLRLRTAPHTAYVLSCEGVATEGTTDGDGVLECEVPADATEATLTLPTRSERYALVLNLSPADTARGASARLHNLGFFSELHADALTPSLRSALMRYQRARGLTVTGELDPTTAHALEQDHDS